MKLKLWTLLLLCASVLASVAQQPQVRNTHFTTEPAGISLSAAVDRFLHSDKSQWIGYSVTALPQAHLASCPNRANTGSGCCGEYSLEDSVDHITDTGQDTPTSTELYILLRLDHGKIVKIRAVNGNCHLNAGGLPFTWITGVKPEDSTSFLKRTIETAQQGNSFRLIDDAFVALALHATSEATQVLSGFATSKQDLKIREKAAFWLGVERGHDGFAILQKLAREDSDGHFREKLAFPISQSSDAQSTDELIRMAESDAEPKVRSQALFWLAQKAGKKATAALSAAIENDPELEVKKRAVFALSQLPKEESVPKLIHVAETNSSPSIKREAIFWLGQSNDTRALEYLEQLLRH